MSTNRDPVADAARTHRVIWAFCVVVVIVVCVVLVLTHRPGLPVHRLSADVSGTCAAHGDSVLVTATVANRSIVTSPVDVIGYGYDPAGESVGHNAVVVDVGAGSTRGVSFTIPTSSVPATCSLQLAGAPPFAPVTGGGPTAAGAAT